MAGYAEEGVTADARDAARAGAPMLEMRGVRTAVEKDGPLMLMMLRDGWIR